MSLRAIWHRMRASCTTAQPYRTRAHRSLWRFVRDENAATAIEYGMIVGLIAVLAVGAISVSGDRLRDLFDNLSSSITSLAERGSGLTSGGSGYQFVAMTDSGHWWNNTELRREQMAEMTDGRLLHEWDHYAVGYFRSAVERGDNSICNNCRGAGNRLDLMHIVLSEMETRGLATDDHRSTMRDSIQTYQTHFSE